MTKLLFNIGIALRNIRGNLLRTILTFLIIAFGIMALVGILTAIDSIKASISSNFSSMGANSFEIRKKGTGIVRRRGSRAKSFDPITFEQAQSFKTLLDYPATISLSTMASGASVIKYENEKTNPNIRIMGGDENYLSVGGMDLSIGRNFSEFEVQTGRNVAIIGQSISKKLFKDKRKSLEKIIRVNNQKYRVIGVLAASGASSIFSSDNMVLVPSYNVQKNYSQSNRSYVISLALQNTTETDAAITEATGLMRRVRQLRFDEESDFDIQTSDKLASILIDNIQYITLAATIIGVITLLGAAIGLMNIMLVSVTERTREIGISKALGATRNSIATQFLTEAIVICQIGGLLGIVLGILAGNGVSLLLKGPFVIPWRWMFVGIVFCLIVGLVSGLYPAVKASRLDPIESLRYE